MSTETFDLGKKVFFLYPHRTIQDYLHLFLIKNEFEVYLIDDHHALPQLLQKFPNAIAFLNIDEVLSQADWYAYTQSLVQNFPSVVVGVFTGHNDPALAEKYLMGLGIKGGFITLRAGVENIRQTVLKALIANEARGRRRYVRVRPTEGSATFNVKWRGELVTGVIYDISSAGVSASFDQDYIDLPEKTVLRDVLLMYRGLRVKADLVITIKRAQPGKKTTYVMLFDESILPTDREKIHTCVQRALQQDLEKWLEQFPKT